MIGQATPSIPLVTILAHVSTVDDLDPAKPSRFIKPLRYPAARGGEIHYDPAIFLDGRGGDLVSIEEVESVVFHPWRAEELFNSFVRTLRGVG